MRKFKHKKLNLIASKEFNRCSDGYYQIENDEIVRASIIEDSNDWEEVKEPLFVTEDGKEIYEGEDYIFVTEYWIAVTNIKGTLYHSTENRPRFKHKEAANEYIEQNKPRFSVKDIEEALAESSLLVLGGDGRFRSEKKFKQKLGI